MVEHTDEIKRFEELLRKQQEGKYLLRLYVAGLSPRSEKAIESVKGICERYLKNRYTLEVIDVYKSPKLARGEQIIAAPTLVKVLPEPLKRIVGDLSKEDKLLIGLDLKELKDSL